MGAAEEQPNYTDEDLANYWFEEVGGKYYKVPKQIEAYGQIYNLWESGALIHEHVELVDHEVKVGGRSFIQEGARLAGKVIVAEECVIAGSIEGFDKETVVGYGVGVAKNASISNSVIKDYVEIGQRAHITGSEVGFGAKIGENADVTFSEIGSDTVIDRLAKITGSVIGGSSSVGAQSGINKSELGVLNSVGVDVQINKIKSAQEVTFLNGATIGPKRRHLPYRSVVVARGQKRFKSKSRNR